MNALPKIDVIWTPQAGPQTSLFECPLPEVLFGGARGGGKTDGVLGKWGNKALIYGEAFNAVMFRKTAPSQDDAWERAKQLYTPCGAQCNETTKFIRFPNNARIRFRTLERVQDAEKYQGQNLTDVWIEEAGTFADSIAIDRLHGAIRSPHGIPTQMILTGNPGGAGQHWIKRRYIDPHPSGNKILNRALPNGAVHQYAFIPSRIQDNKILLDNDPGYINRLYLVGNDKLVEAWLEGNWDAIEGAYFDYWSSDLIIRPFPIPSHWVKIRGFDWGSAKPFSMGWFAVASEDIQIDDDRGKVLIPKNALVQYREYYGAKIGDDGVIIPDVGLKMTDKDVAREILAREHEKIDYSVADPSIFIEDGGPSKAENMRMFNQQTGKADGVTWNRADNSRVAGWGQMNQRMKGEAERPMIYFFNTCTEAIRTIPALQHDLKKLEDLDTKQEDHPADMTRYVCMSRPWTRTLKTKPRRLGGDIYNLHDLLKAKKGKPDQRGMI